MDSNGTKESGIREKILVAARKIFAMHGFHGASMRDIAKEAEVNKALLFYYFTSKANLYEEVIFNYHAKVYESIMREMEGISDIRQRFRQAIKSYINQFSVSREFMAIAVREVLGLGLGLQASLEESLEKVRLPLREVLQKGRDEGVFRDIDVDYTATAIMGMLQIFFRPFIINKNSPKFDKEFILESTIQILGHGILTGAEEL